MLKVQSPIEADPLPQGVFLKAHIRSLRREVRHLKKNLEKTEDKLKKSEKNYADAATEISRLHQSSRQLFKEYNTKKFNLNEELEGVKGCASKKS